MGEGGDCERDSLFFSVTLLDFTTHRKQNNLLLKALLLYLYEMDVSRTSRSNHFTMYVNQTVVLYTLNFHSGVCQLKLEGKSTLLTRRKVVNLLNLVHEISIIIKL